MIVLQYAAYVFWSLIIVAIVATVVAIATFVAVAVNPVQPELVLPVAERDPDTGEIIPNLNPPKIDRDPTTKKIRSATFELKEGSAFALFEHYESGQAKGSQADDAFVERALTEFLRDLDVPKGGPKEVRIKGNADIRPLQRVEDPKKLCGTTVAAAPWYRFDGDVAPEPNSNECLAFIRAFNVAEMLSRSEYRPAGDEMLVGFDPTPFLESANVLLERQLFSGTDIGNDRKQMQAYLGIAPGFTHADLGGLPELKSRVEREASTLEPKLHNFRSVVVLVRHCPTGCAAKPSERL
ncbi:MAG TPA: hypothetical protein VL069_15375 [Opitutus sp.]|nr:hypothetical protein [Opitutus sp.]